MSDKELDGGEAAAMYALELRKAQEHIAELEADLTRIAELEEERDMLRNALARIRDYNPPDEMSHKAWRVRINVMRHWAWKALARKGRKDGEG